MSLEDTLYPLLALYERLPAPLRRIVGGSYRRLPKGWRLGSAFAGFEDLAASGESWTAEQAREYQLGELQRTLRYAETHCPFYQQRFAQAGFRAEAVRELKDLAGCPCLEKRDVIDHLHDLTSRAVPASRRLYITTGGSTGVPVGFYLQKGVSRPKEQAFLEALWRRAGYSADMRLAVIRGHVTTDKAAGRITSYDATRDWLMLSSYHLTQERLPDYLDALERFRPDMLHIYPSAALQLAGFLENARQDWRLPLRGLLCGSERLTGPQKRLLERVFRCRVYRWYGHSERIVLAGEGRRSELFYFWPQYGCVEFGPPDEDGLCEIIGTSFHNLAMPMVRYRTGDYAQLAAPTRPSSEALEYPWAAATDVVGREHEFLVSATGRRISLTAFNMHGSIFDDLYAVQFYQAEPGQAELRYIPAPGFQQTRLEAIAEGVRHKLGDDFSITFRKVLEVEKTARGKHRWLVTDLK